MDLWKWAERTETSLSLSERVWRVIEIVTIRSVLVLGALTSIAAILVRLYRNLYWWEVVLAVWLFLILCAFSFNQYRIWKSLHGKRLLDLPAFANECIAFYEDYSEFMVSHQREMHRQSGEPTRDSMHREWAANVEYSNRMNSMILQKFAPRALYLTQVMRGLEIPVPHMNHFGYHDGGTAAHIGLVGELLSRGLIDDARKLDPHTAWGVGFR
jgi:hypothetical protein